VKQRTNAIAGLEYVSRVMKTYLLHEETYLSTPHRQKVYRSSEAIEDVGQQLETEVIALYQKLLDYQVSMACHYTSSPTRRFVGKVFVMDDWQGMLLDIKYKAESSRLDMGAMDSSRLAFLFEEGQRNARRVMVSCLASNYEANKKAYADPVTGTVS
jgi:N-terminal domain of NWD NACHT-NTPase